MAYARKMKYGVADESAYFQAMLNHVRGEYSVKKDRFSNLKDDVIQLQYTVEKLCGTQRQEKENLLSHLNREQLQSRVENVKGRLLMMMTEIRSLLTEDSDEHRLYKALAVQAENWCHCQPMSLEQQGMVECLSDLQHLHEENCKAKTDVENIVNRAHHQLNKLEKVLRQPCQPLPTCTVKGKSSTTITSNTRRVVLRDNSNRM